MTNQKQNLFLHQSCDRIIRNDFPSFIAKVFHTVSPNTDYLHNWHIDCIADYLEACRKGNITRLVINMPPRHLKSISVSVAWPAFLLGHNPSARIMTSSYSQHLSVKHSVDCRLVIQSDWYQNIFPDTIISADQNEKHKFTTTARGHRIATSTLGSATGEGGNFLIIDDPLNPLQALNNIERTATNHWFDNTFATRLDDKKKDVIVVVTQRLHCDDLSGYLLSKKTWEHLCLPAVAPDNIMIFNKYIRNKGDALHKDREDSDLLEKAKIELGSYNFSAQYQQAPVLLEGGMVNLRWFKRFRHPVNGEAVAQDLAPQSPEILRNSSTKNSQDDNSRITQSWDTAIKAGSDNDASVCATFLERDGNHYLLDILSVRAEYPELKRLIVNMAQKYNPSAILLEDKASGQSLLQDLRKEPNNLPLIPIMPKGDKITRFAQITPLIEAGKIHLPEFAPWLPDFEQEITAFPNAKHDDMVDVFSQYLNWIRGKTGGGFRVRSV